MIGITKQINKNIPSHLRKKFDMSIRKGKTENTNQIKISGESILDESRSNPSRKITYTPGKTYVETTNKKELTSIKKYDRSGLGNRSLPAYNFKLIYATDHKIKHEFKTESGLEYEAVWILDRNNNNECWLDLSFWTKSKKSYTEITNRGELYRVMSTVIDIFEQVYSNHPDISHWIITPQEEYDKMHPKKYKMYLHYLKKNCYGELIFDEYNRAVWKFKKNNENLQ